MLIIFIVFGALKHLSIHSSKLASTYGTDCLQYFLDFEDQKEFFKYASGDKVPTLMGNGIGIYKCYCKEFSDLMDLADNIEILESDEHIKNDEIAK